MQPLFLTMAAKDNQILIDNLSSKDEEVVLETIESLQDKGNQHLVTPLLDLLLTDPAYGITTAITELLGNMRDKPSIDAFMAAITEPKYEPIQHHLLSILWNGNFTARANPILLPIVTMGVKGTFATLIEALTVIENLESPFDEEQLLEGISICKSYLAENRNDDKSPLVSEILEILIILDNTNSDIEAEDQD